MKLRLFLTMIAVLTLLPGVIYAGAPERGRTYSEALTLWSERAAWAEVQDGRVLFHVCVPAASALPENDRRVLIALDEASPAIMEALAPLVSCFEDEVARWRITETREITRVWRDFLRSDLASVLFDGARAEMGAALLRHGIKLDAASWYLEDLELPSAPPVNTMSEGLCGGKTCPGNYQSCDCKTMSYEDPVTKKIPKSCDPPRLDCDVYVTFPKTNGTTRLLPLLS